MTSQLPRRYQEGICNPILEVMQNKYLLYKSTNQKSKAKAMAEEIMLYKAKLNGNYIRQKVDITSNEIKPKKPSSPLIIITDDCERTFTKRR